jgi:hypothetical protein
MTVARPLYALGVGLVHVGVRLCRIGTWLAKWSGHLRLPKALDDR